MRIVATSDTHFPFSADKIPDGDIFIHAGDLMYSGYVAEWYPRLESLAALPHKYKLLVPGNHDFHIENYYGIAKAELRRQAGVRLLGVDKPVIEIEKKKFFGIPYVTGLPGWAYNREEDWLRDYLIHVDGADVVVSHAPCFGKLDAVNPEGNTTKERNQVGSWAAGYWWKSLMSKPELWINGHIHESYGELHEDGTSFYNVSMCDRDYQQVNPPVVIDL